MIGDLRDLIAALDRREPNGGHGLRRKTAREAATVTQKALARLEGLIRTLAASR